MKNEIHFIIVIDGSSYRPMYEAMLSDVQNRDDVTIVVDNKRKSFLREILLKRKIQNLTRGFLDFLCYEKNNLYNILEQICGEYEKVFVIFTNAAFYYNPYLVGTLRKYRERWNNIKFILYYTDIIGKAVTRTAYYLQDKNVFDLVYTIDAEDAKKYNMNLWKTIYSANKEHMSQEVGADSYFCGVSKGRSEILLNVISQAKQNGANVEMDIICENDAEKYAGCEGINVLTPGEHVAYSEVLKKELQTNCILEVVQRGQVALTLRPYEAVVYNRKLLTNNRSIYDFDFYDERYMRYFPTAKDIDWEWVKEKVEVNYGYKGEFSPFKLLKNIEEKFSNESNKKIGC